MQYVVETENNPKNTSTFRGMRECACVKTRKKGQNLPCAKPGWNRSGPRGERKEKKGAVGVRAHVPLSSTTETACSFTRENTAWFLVDLVLGGEFSGFRPGTASESGIVAGHVQGSGLSRDAGRGLCKNNGIYYYFFFRADLIGWGLANGVEEGEKLRRQMKPKQSEKSKRKKKRRFLILVL